MTTKSYAKEQTTEVRFDLCDIRQNFQDQNKRLSDVLERIICVVHRLANDSGNIKEGESNVAVEPKDCPLPGIISGLYCDIYEFRKVNNGLEFVVSKLEKFI